MRNLKKILALVLALVMSMSLLATANAFEDSKDIDADFTEAVEVLNALKVFQGYDNGKTFQPKGAITRAEVAAIIYRIVTGDVKDAQKNIYSDYNQFDDVTSDKWYAGYVNFCANAEIIKGYSATKFGPNDTVTGYQALAMILRAIGYDKNGEFTGTGWQVQTAAVAKKLGITDNIAAGTLGTAATREVVAEILFQTIAYAKQVDYTIAFGYSDWNNDTLGYETFKLVGAVLGDDQWGRPANTWKLDKAPYDREPKLSDTTLVAIPFAAEVSYTTAVDECDIAKDLGITSSKNIEAAFIDGESYKTTDSAVTTNRYGSINPKATTSYVGAQGRLTEIYDMGAAGYRVVEINTYLGQVSKVVAEKVDKNGHVTPAYVEISIWADAFSAGVLQAKTTLKYYTDEMAKDDYVLVTVSEASKTAGIVASAEVTAPVAAGTLKGYTINTTKVSDVTYDDADKFVLNNKKVPTELGKNYNVFVDQYDNVIGLAEAANNYLVIEAIRWIHDGTLYGGYALADVVLADGTRVEGVTVASVGTKLVTNTGDKAGSVPAATVSDYWENNGYYYNHLTTYSVDAEGNYHLGCNTTDPKVCFGVNDTNVDITKGITTIKGATNTVVANDNTVFLVKDIDKNTYTTYVGKNNVPSMTNATICYLAAGYASVVLVTNYTLASNTFVAYVPTETTAYQNTDWYYGIYNGKYAYDVYKLGETEPTTIYSDDADLFGAVATSTNVKDGFYKITVTANGVASKATIEHFMGAYDADVLGSSDVPYADLDWYRAWVKTDLVGNSLMTSSKDYVTAVKDFYVDDAKYFVVDKVALPAGGTYTTVTEGSAADMVKGTKVVVAYIPGTNVASYVYAIVAEGADVSNPAAVTSVSVNWKAAPKAGQMLGGFVYDDTKVSMNVRWYDANLSEFVGEDTLPVPGHSYVLVASDIEAAAGYYLANNFAVTGWNNTVAGEWTFNVGVIA